MNGSQLEKCLKSDRYTRPIFHGVFPSDVLQKVKIESFPCCLIANTDPSDKSGEHWVAFFIDINGHGEYFDSYGRRPKLKDFKNFLKFNSKDYRWNSTPLQGPFTTVCGQYCMFYLLHRSRNFTMEEICGFFNKDKAMNDFLVNEFITEHFALDTQPSDTQFIIDQISRALLEK